MDAKPYRLLLSPDLAVSPQEFAAVWDRSDQAQHYGKADLSTAKGTQFDLDIVAGTIITIVTNLASSALYDYLKMLFLQLPPLSQQGREPQKHLHIEELKHPDGTSLLIIDYQER